MRALFGYIALIALQLKIIWGAWWVRDLTRGDTSVYFVNAADWHAGWITAIAWSPLYTSFYGMLLFLSSDAYAVTIAHRVLIVIAATTIFYAALCRLFPRPFAWLIAAWWAVLPINFETLYEVHLFAAIPLFIAVLLALSLRPPWNRSLPLAFFAITCLAVRNETIIAFCVFGGCVIYHELFRRAGARFRIGPYLIPLLAVAAVVSFFVVRDQDLRNFGAVMRSKHAFNICQVYAFGYQQRHPEWTASPWTECQGLMSRDFGAPQPTLGEAFARNPGAMLEHLAWNLGLIPAGTQIGLFNSASGSQSPDYAPVELDSARAAILTILCGVAIVGGALRMRRDASFWKSWFERNAWGIAAMSGIVATALVVAITERPRPSYLFGYSASMMIAIATCLYALGRGWRGWQRCGALFPVLALAAIAVTPSYYSGRPKDRPLHDHYRRLTPWTALFRQKGIFVSNVFSSELCSYLCADARNCHAVDYAGLGHPQNAAEFRSRIGDQGANLLYADESLMRDPDGNRVVTELQAGGWRRLGGGTDWRLITDRPPLCEDGPDPGGPDIELTPERVRLGDNWRPAQHCKDGRPYRWVDNDCVFLVRPGGKATELRIEIEPGPGVRRRPFSMSVHDRLDRAFMVTTVTRQQVVSVPLDASRDEQIVRLHTGDGGPMSVQNFRIFSALLHDRSR